MENLNYLEELKQQLKSTKSNLSRYYTTTCFNYKIPLFDQDGELNDDAYQETLEINYWLDEQRDLIQQLEIEIERIEKEMSNNIAVLLSK